MIETRDVVALSVTKLIDPEVTIIQESPSEDMKNTESEVIIKQSFRSLYKPPARSPINGKPRVASRTSSGEIFRCFSCRQFRNFAKESPRRTYLQTMCTTGELNTQEQKVF